MKRLQYIPTLLLLLLALLAGCTENELFQDDEQVVLRYNVSLPQDAQTRAEISFEGYQLKVGVFEKGVAVSAHTFDMDKNGSCRADIALVKGITYDLVFWAQKKDIETYDTDKLDSIKIDYSQYQDISVSQATEYDAFCATSTETAGSALAQSITLIRPFACLSIGETESKEVENLSTVSMTLTAYTCYHPLTRQVSVPQEVIFNYKGEFDQTLEVDGSNYTALATAYLPESKEKVSCTAEFGTDYQSRTFEGLLLEANKRTNIIGKLLIPKE